MKYVLVLLYHYSNFSDCGMLIAFDNTALNKKIYSFASCIAMLELNFLILWEMFWKLYQMEANFFIAAKTMYIVYVGNYLWECLSSPVSLIETSTRRHMTSLGKTSNLLKMAKLWRLRIIKLWLETHVSYPLNLSLQTCLLLGRNLYSAFYKNARMGW